VARPLFLASCVGAALIALYSCSMQASVTTDGNGRIVELSSLRIGSKLSNWALEMLVVGGQLAVELRRIRPTGTTTRSPSPRRIAMRTIVECVGVARGSRAIRVARVLSQADAMTPFETSVAGQSSPVRVIVPPDRMRRSSTAI